MPVRKEWTLLFYFACDNALAPGVVAQLKALKQAGYHPDVNVVVQFDPQTRNTPTHIFDVNLVNKVQNPDPDGDIGFANDPFVRTLMEDKLWRNLEGEGPDESPDQQDRTGKSIRERIKESLQGRNYDPPSPLPTEKKPEESAGTTAPGTDRRPRRRREPGVKESLKDFLKFCSDNYPANNFMIFILGHGIVVGNDIFLFDENVDDGQHSLSLTDLGDVLNGFAADVRKQKSEVQLVSFHSCSVSSAEVAYQLQMDVKGKLKGTANYMLASQGPAFVASWPYREIIMRVLNDVKNKRPVDAKDTVTKIFYYVLHNSTDFVLAGYAFNLVLCDLNKVSEMTVPLKTLSDNLARMLRDKTNPAVKNLILLAHWRAISFWGENYTDLFDFCFCLRQLCDEYDKTPGSPAATISANCGEVLKQLEAGVAGNDDKLIVRTAFAGPDYQYSHGLSVYFPWAAPLEDFMATYHDYAFTKTNWQTFLEAYFDETQRLTLREELGQPVRVPSTEEERREDLNEDIVSICFNNAGPLNTDASSSVLALPSGKRDPPDPTGDDCACNSIKNYPHDTRNLRKRSQDPLGHKDNRDPLGPRDNLRPASHDAFNLFQ